MTGAERGAADVERGAVGVEAAAGAKIDFNEDALGTFPFGSGGCPFRCVALVALRGRIGATSKRENGLGASPNELRCADEDRFKPHSDIMAGWMRDGYECGHWNGHEFRNRR